MENELTEKSILGLIQLPFFTVFTKYILFGFLKLFDVNFLSIVLALMYTMSLYGTRIT